MYWISSYYTVSSFLLSHKRLYPAFYLCSSFYEYIFVVLCELSLFEMFSASEWN
jgi:hypothetical protein